MTGQKGTLKTWNDAKGFGFIKPDNGGLDVFAHIRDFKDRGNRPTVGDTLAYQVAKDGNGRARACNVVALANLNNPAVTLINSSESWLTGTLRIWDDKKGFGFIQPRDGGGDVFIHIKDFRHDNYRPLPGGVIHYRLKTDNGSKPKAYAAMMAQADFKVAKNKVTAMVWLLILMPFLLSLIAIYKSHTPLPFLVYLAMSASAVVVYANDKKKAKTGEWRTTESFLHWIELLGGWPGALFAQREIRHKNNKSSYQIIFLGIVFLHLGSWSYYLLSQFTAITLRHSFLWP